MGLIKTVTIPDGDIIPDAYLRIQNIISENVDYEVYENVPDSEDQIVSWKSAINTSAVIYVWPDQSARKNRAIPIHWFKFEFKYDVDSPDNIYTQAYNALLTELESNEN